jgi:hypothetical protein
MAATVRVEDNVHAMLLELAKEEHRPIGQVIEDAIERYRREKFWKGVNEDLERLRADPIAWKDYQDEIALLEGGSMDGLRTEPPYFTPEEEEEIRARARA